MGKYEQLREMRELSAKEREVAHKALKRSVKVVAEGKIFAKGMHQLHKDLHPDAGPRVIHPDQERDLLRAEVERLTALLASRDKKLDAVPGTCPVCEARRIAARLKKQRQRKRGSRSDPKHPKSARRSKAPTQPVDHG